MQIAVLGATGKTGRYVVAKLCEIGHDVRAVGRDPMRLATLDPRARRITVDLESPDAVPAALSGAECVVNIAHARFTRCILAALPDTCSRVVITGSTRKFSTLPDPAAEQVRDGELAFQESGRVGVMLHPAMIYGAPDDRNVNRILRLIRRWPKAVPVVLPLPDGGRHLLQPVFVDDAVDAIVASILRPEAPGPPLVVAGPEPITYAAMLRICASALGRRLHVLPIPSTILVAFARLAEVLGFKFPFDAAEVRRAAEDKEHDIRDMERRLGVKPRPFEEGLRLKLTRDWA